VPDEFYHIYNRGTEKRILFLDADDYKRFVELLYLCNTEQQVNIRDIRSRCKSVYDHDRGDLLVSVGAYCIMPNHYHLLLTTSREGGIAKYMGKLATSYSMYFNKKYQRSGRLFQGTYKSKFIDTDEYLKYMYAYIHLNPAKLSPELADRTLGFVSEYEYSSLRQFLQPNEQFAILQPAAFPEYFTQPVDHLHELKDWIFLG